MKRSFMISGLIACFILSVAAFLQASGITPAIVPALVPAANKQGNSNVFMLAASNSLGNSVSLCTDSNGNAATSGCSPAAPTPAFTQTNFPNPAVTGTTMPTSLLSTGVGSLTLPANYFTSAGQVLVIDWTGFFNPTNGTGSDVFTLKLGTYTAFLGSTGPLTAVNGAGLCEAHFVMTTPTVGAGGTIIGAQNNLLCENPASNHVILNAPTNAATTSAFDTTASHVITFTVTPGDTVQTFTTTNFIVKGY